MSQFTEWLDSLRAEIPEGVQVYDRDTLMDVVNRHHKVDIKGCVCGWAALGHSIGEHVADVYEQIISEQAIQPDASACGALEEP